MALGTYEELKTSVANWIDRDDLTSRIPDFITLAEARINRNLRIRAMEDRSTATVNAGQDYYGLPDRYVQMRHITIAQGNRDVDLEYLTPERFDLEINRVWAGGAARPRKYTLIGDELRLGPCPSAEGTMQMIYWRTFNSLGDSNTSNWLLSNAPDVLLYGALLEAETFVKNIEAAKGWGILFGEGIQSIQNADDRDRHSGGALHVVADHQGY